MEFFYITTVWEYPEKLAAGKVCDLILQKVQFIVNIMGNSMFAKLFTFVFVIKLVKLFVKNRYFQIKKRLLNSREITILSKLGIEKMKKI